MFAAADRIGRLPGAALDRIANHPGGDQVVADEPRAALPPADPGREQGVGTGRVIDIDHKPVTLARYRRASCKASQHFPAHSCRSFTRRVAGVRGNKFKGTCCPNATRARLEHNAVEHIGVLTARGHPSRIRHQHFAPRIRCDGATNKQIGAIE
jgi:hypothetical protein